MNAALKTIALATFVAGAITLAGCTAGPQADPTAAPTSSTSAPATPAPTSTDDASATGDLSTGDTLDAQAAEKLNAAIRTAGDDRAYQSVDGSWVLLRKGDPLPETIRASIEQNAGAAAAPLGTATELAARDAASSELRSTVKAEEQKTGRTIVAVLHILSFDDASGGYQPTWTVSEPGPVGQFGSSEEALAAAQSWVDKAPASRSVIVIDAIG